MEKPPKPPVANKDINDILAFFDRTADQYFSKEEFRARLATGQKLRIKYGVDVTAPTLHIGHAVNLWLMRALQDRGHRVIFLIGDFTTRIGDPDGKLETRPVISRADIERNARHFIDQARMVLRFDDPDLLEIKHNADWLDGLPLQNFLDLLSEVTHAKLISRDMFQKRIEAGKDIRMHEILYPVLQGWDSVAIASDLTIVGSDQLFNEMMGRFFQERHGQKPQTIITTRVTPGIDGKAKQSKSLGNYVGLAHNPREKFGRVMSIPDPLMEDWFVVYTDLPMTEVAELKRVIRKDPREAKLRLASAIVARYHGEAAGRAEREWFENTFSKGNIPEDVPRLAIVNPRLTVFDLVKLTRPGKSKSDTRRLIKQGGIELQGERLSDPDEHLNVASGSILKVGKRNWYRVEVLHLDIIETERLWVKPLELEDIDLIVKYLPEWDIVKYLTRPISAKVEPAKRGGPVFELMKPPVAAAATKVADTIAREVFKKVIAQPEPKDEWLFKIQPKSEPEKIIGVAHLRRDFEHGNQNVWLDPAHRDQGYAKEVTTALNTHAFTNLNFGAMVFKDAFAHAARELEGLRAHFAGPPAQAGAATPPAAAAPAAQGGAGAPAGETFHITREAWQQSQPAQPVSPASVTPPLEDPLLAQPPVAPPPAPSGPVPPPPGPLPPGVMLGAPGAPLPANVPIPPGWVPGMPLPPGWMKGDKPPPPPEPEKPPSPPGSLPFTGAAAPPSAEPEPAAPVPTPPKPTPGSPTGKT
jgi:tyrosyl-tRNA synthetase